MDTSTSDDKLEPVTEMKLIDVSSVRDNGMKALILLARSLDWNVMQKPNQPVVITSRTGLPRRIPTNTSIRMSVFQSHLSSILLHSTLEATSELMEQIIRSVKPNREQANRLREAVGMSVQEHRRQTEEERVPPAVELEAALTQNINIVWEEPPGPRTGPADDGEHGTVVSEKPFLATVSGKGKGGGYVYESQTSNERVWSDGYYDYTCLICGRAYPHPKGVGSHRQTHVQAGEVEPLVQAKVVMDSKRRPTEEERQWIAQRDRGTTVVKTSKAPKEPVPDVIATYAKDRPMTVPEVRERVREAVMQVNVDEVDTRGSVVEQIAALVAPEIIAERDALRLENVALRNDLEKLRSDLTGLKDIIGGLG